MEVRMLQQHEILPALHLVWDVFVTEVAPGYTPEGVAEFQKFIKYENIHQMWQRGNIFFFGAFDGAELCGTLAYGPDGHIMLFFVRKQYQGKGIGRMMFQAAYNDCALRLRVSKLTVNSAPGAVDKYVHMGMHQTSEEQVRNGIRYVPMEMYVSQSLVAPVKKKLKIPVLIAVVIGVILVISIIAGGIALAGNIWKNIQYYQEYRDPFEAYGDDSEDGFWDDGDDYDDDSDHAENLDGIWSIPESIAGDLTYEIQDETYTFSDDEKQSVLIEFNVTYPVISGLSETSVEKQVNEALKVCAMETVEQIYNNPSNDIKERVLGEEYPTLVDYVEYKTCYASENFISVAYEDYSYQGGEDYYVQHLRTCNISLKDGKIYEVKDIVELSDQFLDEWLETMRGEVDDDIFLSELTKEELRKTLMGDSLNGAYVANFFVDADGIEIGYDLNYSEDDSNNLGYVWVTAPFSFNEIKEYLINGEFWK